jgi:ubiquinone/menaquinone biosynthesis C-methylase UbiE
MMKDSAEQFNPIASNYADSPVHRQGPSLAALRRLAEPVSSDVVLDIATGTGHTALALASLAAAVIGVDLADGMLAEGIRLSRESAVPNISFQKAAAENLPFPDESFTLVTSRLAPHHFRQLNAFLAESFRVLRPGGRMVVADQVSPTAESKAWINRWETLRDPSHYDQRTPREWRECVEKVGFRWGAEETVWYRFEFDWWVRQANCSPGQIDELSAHARLASPAVREALRIEFAADGQVLAHRLPVMVVRLEKVS